MTFLALVFFVGVVGRFFAALWLGERQVRCVRRHRNKVPSLFAEILTLDAHQRAADLAVAAARFNLIDLLFDIVWFFLWTLGGSLDALDLFWRSRIEDPLILGLVFIASFVATRSLLELPFYLYRRLVINQRFNLNRASVGVLLGHRLKGLMISLAASIPIAAVVLWWMTRGDSTWWISAWVLWIAIMLFRAWAHPTLIAPRFTKLAPLNDHELKDRLSELLERCQFHGKTVPWTENSRQSKASRAYLSGVGTNRRVVLSDSLLKVLSAPQIEAVVAHEIAHYKLHHFSQRMAISAILSGLTLMAFAALVPQTSLYAALGVTRPSNHIALILLALIMPFLAYYVRPLRNSFLRRMEFAADRFAAGQTSPEELIKALVKVYSHNKSTVTPDPLYSAVRSSHPPAPIRIARLASLGASKASSIP